MIKDIWYVKGVNIFEEVTDREIRLLERRSKLKKYGKYDFVCDKLSDSSSIYVIKEGSVRIYKPESKEDSEAAKSYQTKSSRPLPTSKAQAQEGATPGSSGSMTNRNDIFSQLMANTTETDSDKKLEQLPVTLESGEFFGAMRNSGQMDNFLAETMNDSQIYLTRYSTLKLLFKYISGRSITVKKFAGLRRYELQNRIQNLIGKDVVSRLASLLLRFSEKYGTWQSSKSVLDFKLSSDKLSTLVGATKEDVEQVLELLEREKIVSIEGKKIEVLNGWQLRKKTLTRTAPRL